MVPFAWNRYDLPLKAAPPAPAPIPGRGGGIPAAVPLSPPGGRGEGRGAARRGRTAVRPYIRSLTLAARLVGEGEEHLPRFPFSPRWDAG
jgi:hypothetical protein